MGVGGWGVGVGGWGVHGPYITNLLQDARSCYVNTDLVDDGIRGSFFD